MRDKSPILSAWRRSNAAPAPALATAYGDQEERETGRDAGYTLWTAATFHNAKFGARSGATPQDAQEPRRDSSPDNAWETHTRSNYTRTILASGICANMDRLAPDKARARVAGVIQRQHDADADAEATNAPVGSQSVAKADVKH